MRMQASLSHAGSFARSELADWWWSVDRVLVAIFLGLIFLGLVLSMAASPAAAIKDFPAEPFHYFTRHSAFAAAAVLSLIGVSLLDPVWARRLAIVALACAIVLMLAILFAGHEAKGGMRWIRIGSFSLQPSEFAKPGLIVTIAWLFSRGRANNGPGALISFGLYIFLAFLLFLQPDFGQTVLITMAFGAVFFMSGISWPWIAALATLTVGGSFGAYKFLPHVTLRINNFLAPSGQDRTQMDMVMDALTGGGLFGRGPGEGVIKTHLPEAHTDFIFSVAAEEFGLMASLLIIGLFVAVMVRGYTRAVRMTDHTAQLAAAGLTTLIGMQAFINIAVNLQIVPPKGMTLPFISYGGSSMLAMALTAGLLLAFTRKRPGAFE